MILNSMKNNSPSHSADTLLEAINPDVVKLAGLVSTYAPHDGRFSYAFPGHTPFAAHESPWNWCMPRHGRPYASWRKERRE
jgi:hypothetical protein